MAKLWGGRFSKKTNPLVEEFTKSIQFDKKLAAYDCAGSIAHARMLGKCKIIPKKDAVKIVSGLNSILNQIKKGSFKVDNSVEDIHTAIQNALDKKIGKSSGMLHTARSRNDQVSLDTRMYCKEEINSILALLAGLKASIKGFSKKNIDVIVPGFTHLQNAQPVLLSHQMLAYCQMLGRDIDRLNDCKKRVDVLPLGSCAISGTSLPIDRNFVAKELGFSKISSNSMDAVSDRDFVIEIIASLAIIGMHLSRLSEDLIIWNSQVFGFLDIGDEYSTGSSMMPQKKNPDVLELIRGKCGTLYGSLVEVMTMMKGLPLTYNRDMQLDKEPLFKSVETVRCSLKILIAMFKCLKVNKEKASELLNDEAIYATDIMEYLVKKGVPLKESHDIVGKIVAYGLQRKLKLSEISLREYRFFSPKFNKDAYELLDAKKSVSLKNSFGGTSFKQVRRQLENA
ncbi:MAG: argininosuccinate lyase [Candidatus Omnitrophica bacterium]|nr:argininosuccinate lyase [Candidatus Omnitrophota bacterium]